jgi:hypothetical protein
LYPKENKKAKKRFEYDEEYDYTDSGDDEEDYYNEEVDEEPPFAGFVPVRNGAQGLGIWNNNINNA